LKQDIFKIHFSKEHGRIIIDTYLSQKDQNGYFLTVSETSVITTMLNEVIRMLKQDGLEALR